MGKKGRPSKNQQVELQKALRTCYERNLSASYAAQNTGANIKTVAKYYEIWSEQIAKASETDFITRQRQDRNRIRCLFFCCLQHAASEPSTRRLSA